MTALLFVTVSVLTCVAVTVVIKGLLAESFRQGHRLGYRQGTYDALKTDLSASATIEEKSFFRCVDKAASKTQFPHR